jgi:hypothetical protein
MLERKREKMRKSFEFEFELQKIYIHKKKEAKNRIHEFL